MKRFGHIALAVLCGLATPAGAQLDGNADEAKVRPYVLPDALRMADGTSVTTARQWWTRRRPELLAAFTDTIFGAAPVAPASARFVVVDMDRQALGGTAVRKQVTILLDGTRHGPQMSVLIYLPARAAGPVPVFVGLNFHGNQAVNADTAIRITPGWVAAPGVGIVKHSATPASRGIEADEWPIARIIAAGYGVATYFSGDLYPDGDQMVAESIQPFYRTNASDPGHWGAVATWAWGLSRVYDYLATDRAVDARRVIVIGHSRNGKAALWAGASDRRFGAVISNDSGEGGAALYRRNYGETIRVMNRYWFAPAFKTFAEREPELPVDAHELIALVAPRPVYVASASEDWWSDPRGEFLAARNADPVYRLLTGEGLATDAMPAAGQGVLSRISYHLRAGPHEITPWDWERYIRFADRYLPPVRKSGRTG